MSDIDTDRLAVLENRAAELERQLLLVMRPEGDAYPNVAVPYAVPEGRERNVKGGGSRGGAPASTGGPAESCGTQSSWAWRF